MADLTITASAVVPGTGAQYLERIAGEAIAQGEPVYIKSSDDRFWRADANVTSAEAAVVGLAVNGAAAAGQPVKAQISGELALGSILTQGGQYILSRNVGKICPVADLTTGDFVTNLFVAKTATTAQISIYASGVQKP